MSNQSTINKLVEMRLSSMADAFWIQMNDTAVKEIPFEDRFGMLVDVKYTNRKNNRLKRLIWWSREAPPCHIAVIGLRHPLREPYVPLSEYTALLLLVQTKLTFCG